MIRRRIGTAGLLGMLLLEDEKLFEEFVQELPVTVTDMFRDPAFYKSLKDKVFNRLATYPFIKIWIAGCATGEEVYSLAILLEEAGLLGRSRIYATDINQRSLQLAREGRYPVENLEQYASGYKKAGGKKLLSDYYRMQHDSVLFNDNLKPNMIFAMHNLVMDQSFNEFHLIICRNVLIYFNQKLQNAVIDLFYESLCPFGFLGLGSKESLLYAEKRKKFDDVDRKEKIFMKTE